MCALRRDELSILMTMGWTQLNDTSTWVQTPARGVIIRFILIIM